MKKELKIGIFAVAVIVASFFVLNYLRGKDIFNHEIEVTGVYDDVQGLVASAPVFIKGYNAGKVTDVTYSNESRSFTVTCSVSKEFSIPEDSKMAIYSVDIMGGKGVKILLGTSEQMIGDGDTLCPVFEAGLMDALAENITPLLSKVSNTLDSLNTTVAGVNKMLSEANVASITRTLANLDATMSNVKDLSNTINGKSEEINSLLTNLADFSTSLKDLASKVDTTIEGVNGVVGKLNASDLEGVVTSFKKLLDNINDPDGTVGKLFNEDSVYNSVDSLLQDLNVLVDKIQENPKKYLKISVF